MDMSFYCGCNEGYKNDKSLTCLLWVFIAMFNTMSPSRATIGVILCKIQNGPVVSLYMKSLFLTATFQTAVVF